MKNEFKLSNVEKYTKGIVTIDYKEETYQVTIEEQFNGNNIMEVIDCNTNDSIEDSELEIQLIEFAYEKLEDKRERNTYSFFLFGQLTSAILKVEYEYDIFFEDVRQLYNEYNDSSFNDANQSEYDCMVNYLNSIKETFKNNK